MLSEKDNLSTRARKSYLLQSEKIPLTLRKTLSTWLSMVSISQANTLLGRQVIVPPKMPTWTI